VCQSLLRARANGARPDTSHAVHVLEVEVKVIQIVRLKIVRKVVGDGRDVGWTTGR